MRFGVTRAPRIELLVAGPQSKISANIPIISLLQHVTPSTSHHNTPAMIKNKVVPPCNDTLNVSGPFRSL